MAGAEKGLEGTVLEAIWASCNREDLQQESKLAAAITAGDQDALQAALGEVSKERGVLQVSSSNIHGGVPHASTQTPHHHHHDDTLEIGELDAAASGDGVSPETAAVVSSDVLREKGGMRGGGGGGGGGLREPPLCLASRLGNVEAVRLLLAAGFNPETRDPSTGRTALQISRTFETCDCEALLLQAGVHDPDAKHFPLSAAAATDGLPPRLIKTQQTPSRLPPEADGFGNLDGMLMDEEEDEEEEELEELEEWASDNLAAALAAINGDDPSPWAPATPAEANPTGTCQWV